MPHGAHAVPRWDERMQSLNSILVGVDIEQALLIAERAGTRLTLVHSTAHDRYLDPIGMGTIIVGEGPREEAMDRMLALVQDAIDREIECELVMDDRPAGEALVDRAERANADLLLVGKRSKAERDGRRLGRVSKKLVRSATMPLWIVSEDHVGPVRTIVAATDFSSVGNHAVAGAAALAQLFEARLFVVHAVPLEFLPSAAFGTDGFAARADVEQSARIRGATERLAELCDTLAGDVTFEVLDRPPYDALRDFVRDREADLLALGTASRHGLARFLVGNTAEWLVDSIDASLLAFPPSSIPGEPSRP